MRQRPTLLSRFLPALTAVLVVSATSGCAAAARFVSAAETASALSDVIGAASSTADEHHSASDQVGYAVVDGTHGTGLRLEARPGAGRVGLLDEGTTVTVICSATGPRVKGTHATTSRWSYVRTDDGRTGYASDAYLLLDATAESTGPC